MKELLAVISLLVSGAVAEPPAPYPASGWRPSGPAFELPRPGQAQQQQPAQYLPPVDPRNPANGPDAEYGVPEVDVSVQGLPPQREEVQFFQRSPINGQQNVGPAFNSDIRNLDQNLQQIQYQQQQANYREFARQRQLEAQINANRQPRPQVPASFVPRTTSTTTEASTTPEATTVPSTTEISLNEGETLEAKKEKVSVEVTAQKIQEYPGELFLSSLAQLQLQPQFVPLQFGQIKAPLYLQPVQSEKQVAGFDAQTHFAALPSIIAQQKLQQQQGFQSPALLIPEQPQAAPQLQPVTAYQQPQFQAEQVAVQPQAFYGQPNAEPVAQYQPVNYQPQLQAQPQPQFQLQPLPQFGAQPVALQPQPAQFQPQAAQFQPQPGQFQPQPGQFQPAQFQPQPAQFQPQPGQFQPQPNNQDAESIDQNAYQPQLYQSPFMAPQPVQQPGFIQAQLINYPGQDQSQFQQQQLQFQQQQAQFQQQQAQFQQQQAQFQPNQGPDALQSGLDGNQQGNDIEEQQDQGEEGQDEGNGASAVSTAFGTRTQPRVYTQYGAPFPVPKVQAAPASTITTESPADEVTDDGPVVAHAVAIADGSRKKNGKLRRSRLRPIFTLDKSGHLILAQQ